MNIHAEIDDPAEEFHINLKSIELSAIDINKLNEANGMYFDLLVNKAKSKFKTSADVIQAFLDANFIVTYIDNGDTTFVHDKHLDVHTEIDYLVKEEILKTLRSNKSKFSFGSNFIMTMTCQQTLSNTKYLPKAK